MPVRKLCYWFVLSLLGSTYTSSITPVLAQTTDGCPEFSPVELSGFKQELTRKMDELESYINIIGDKDKPDDIKENAIELAIRLFEQGSTIQVTSPRTGKTHTYPLLQYFNQLKDAAGYNQKSSMDYNDATMDNWKRDSPDCRYTTHCTYFERLERFKDKKRSTDRFKKSVEVSLSNREDTFYKEKGWVVLLGNIRTEAQTK